MTVVELRNHLTRLDEDKDNFEIVVYIPKEDMFYKLENKLIIAHRDKEIELSLSYK